MKKRYLAALCLVLGMILALPFVYRELRYRAACTQWEQGDLTGAYASLTALGDYRDSAQLVYTLLAEDPTLSLQGAQRDDVVRFGRWEQDNQLDNGPEPISWIVLDTEEDKLLLLSAYTLEGRSYNSQFQSITWEQCALRSYLNGDFFQTAFSDTEQALVCISELANEDNRARGTEGGLDTIDRVFLLSEIEAGVYFQREDRRYLNARAPATAYAQAHHVQVDEEGISMWWLRTPGTDEYAAMYVDQAGALYTSGAYVDIDYQFGVRPAIWVSLS